MLYLFNFFSYFSKVFMDSKRSQKPKSRPSIESVVDLEEEKTDSISISDDEEPPKKKLLLPKNGDLESSVISTSSTSLVSLFD